MTTQNNEHVLISDETPQTRDGIPNRLKGMRGYLCGAMDRIADGGAGWRIDIQRELADLEMFWLDPTHKPIEIGIEDSETRVFINEMKNANNYDAVVPQMRAIRNVDLRMVDISDALVVNIDLECHACGTYEELSLANRQKKPAIVHIEQGKQHTPNWLLGMLPHEMIFSTWNEVHQYIRHIAHDPVIKHFSRWYFFNFDLCRKFLPDGTEIT
jgi:hypothetical protein